MTAFTGGARWAALVGVSAGVVAVDQISKALVRARIPVGEAVSVLPGCFDLVHGRNAGVVFGMFVEHPRLFTVLNLLTIPLLFWGYRVMPLNRIGQVAWAGIIGGAIGNLIDRLVLGSVTDFIDWYVGAYHWYTFNLADASIVIGVATILALDFFGKHSADDATPTSSNNATDPL